MGYKLYKSGGFQFFAINNIEGNFTWLGNRSPCDSWAVYLEELRELSNIAKSKLLPFLSLVVIYTHASCHLCHTLLEANHQSHPHPREGDHTGHVFLEARSCGATLESVCSLMQGTVPISSTSPEFLRIPFRSWFKENLTSLGHRFPFPPQVVGPVFSPVSLLDWPWRWGKHPACTGTVFRDHPLSSRFTCSFKSCHPVSLILAHIPPHFFIICSHQALQHHFSPNLSQLSYSMYTPMIIRLP